MLQVKTPLSESSNVRRGFEDGLGRRYRPAARNDSEAPLDILCFRHEISDVPAFDFALRERVSRLSDLQHPCFARIKKVDRLNDERGTVVLMSEGAAGARLAEILTDVERTALVLDLNAALYLVRQVVSAIGALHQHARVAHGAIAPERLFVTPRGRLFVTEYALGAALEQLKYSRERYWKELRVALPVNVGLARFDERTDLTQVAALALALILNRPLRDDEYPRQVEELVASARARRKDGTQEPLPSGLREWLKRTLQLDARNSFRSVAESEAAFNQWLSEDKTFTADLGSLEAFMQRYHVSTTQPRVPVQPTPIPRPPVPVRQEPIPAPDANIADASDADASDEDERTLGDEDQQELGDEDQTMSWNQTGKRDRSRLKWIVAGIAVLAVTTVGLFAARHRLASAPPPVVTGTMTVNTDPPGAEVLVDGTTRGWSPLRLALTPGAHTLLVKGPGEPRTIPINITAGAEVSQYLELPKAGTGLGQLQVRTEPAGARITIDGTPIGKTPMTIVELAPGEHTVTLESDLGTVTQKVAIEAGALASLVVPLGTQAGAVSTGWVSVTSPVEVELRENGRLLGTSGIDRIMLQSGKHDIELGNDYLGYREMRSVQVSPGKVAAVSITLPKGMVSLNAVPWASVTIDGESVGDTPIGNLQLTVGPHEVVFRNSELGEQRRVITVSTRTPVRLSVDFTKK